MVALFAKVQTIDLIAMLLKTFVREGTLALATVSTLLVVLPAIVGKFIDVIGGGMPLHLIAELCGFGALFALRDRVWMRAIASLTFLCFALYLALFSSPYAKTCGCFGSLVVIRPWLMFSIDVLLAALWGFSLLPIKDSKITWAFCLLICKLSLSILLSVAGAFAFPSLNVALQGLSGSDRYLMEKLLGDEQLDKWREAKALYIYVSSCRMCVEGLPDFVRYCDENNLKGVVVFSRRINRPNVDSPYVTLLTIPTAEMFMTEFPTKVRLENGQVQAPIAELLK